MFKGPEALEMIDRHVEPVVIETVWSEDHMESSKCELETWRELRHRRPAVPIPGAGSNAAITGNWEGMAKIAVASWVETHITYFYLLFIYILFHLFSIKAEFCCVTQDGLELQILLPQTLKC